MSYGPRLVILLCPGGSHSRGTGRAPDFSQKTRRARQKCFVSLGKTMGKPTGKLQKVWMVFERAGEPGAPESLLASRLSDRITRFDFQEAIDRLDSDSGANPELVLLQGRPGKAAQRQLRMLRERRPTLAVLLLSYFKDAEDMAAWMSDSVMAAIGLARDIAPDRANPYKLSKRETEVLRLMTRGLIKKEIGEQLSISYHTIVHHERSIYEKLGVHTRGAAVAKALMEKLC
jgi:DNA-binding CsgD family transcriptional regulator